MIQLGVCLATLLVLLAVRGPLEDELFSDNPDLYWAMLVSLAGFALAYFARGFLAGKGRFSIYAALLISEIVAAARVRRPRRDRDPRRRRRRSRSGSPSRRSAGLLMIPLMIRRYPPVRRPGRFPEART